MKHSDEFEAFDALVRRVIAVPHSVVKQRIQEHRKQSALNPRKRGPKPKVKSPASDPASADLG